MNETQSIDVRFDHRADSGGRDIDKYSPTLKKHHQLLWIKPLPSGELFDLRPMSHRYLVFRQDDLVYSLSSDQLSNSFRSTMRMQHITEQIPDEELDNFQYLSSTLGGTILFPGKQINRKRTINQARGMNKKIEDRFDLTLECIRLQYLGLDNPLQVTLTIYWNFFDLFKNFDAYVEFFLLQDLVSNGKIKFFLPSENFTQPALPQGLDDYRRYMEHTLEFVSTRSERMEKWAETQGAAPVPVLSN